MSGQVFHEHNGRDSNKLQNGVGEGFHEHRRDWNKLQNGWGQGSHEHRRSSNTLQIVGIGFRPSIGGVLTTLQLLGERLRQL